MLADFLTETAQLVESAMGRWINQAASPYAAPLFEAMGYSVYAGGKRLRPALVLMVGDALGLARDVLLPAACALEMVHTYSLIHDDLPAMDNDDLRRGKPTSHKVFGEATAILAGDALLTLAFQVMTECPLPERSTVAMIRELAIAAGPLGMVGGQAADMLEEGKPVYEERVEFIHLHKTAALIRAAVLLPALAAEVDANTLSQLARFGEAIGLAFQITDDILDEVGNAAIMGKAAGVDAQLKKATYPALYGVEASRQRVDQLTEAAVSALREIRQFKKSHELLAELAHYLRERNH